MHIVGFPTSMCKSQPATSTMSPLRSAALRLDDVWIHTGCQKRQRKGAIQRKGELFTDLKVCGRAALFSMHLCVWSMYSFICESKGVTTEMPIYSVVWVYFVNPLINDVQGPDR